MGKLRDNDDKKQQVNNKIKSLYSRLLDVDEDYAEKLIDWYIEKTNTNIKHQAETNLRKQLRPLKGKTDPASLKEIREIKDKIKKVLPKNYPASLTKGDIVWVNYGQGYAGELSEGHYGIIITREGSNFLVAPLTKTPQPYGENAMEFHNLGLPAKGGPVETAHVIFNQIKFQHYRRLENVIGLSKSKRKNVADKLPELITKYNNIINKE